MKQNPIRQVVFPILAALIWGTAFVAQDVCADTIGTFTFNAARYAIAVLALLVLIAVRGAVHKDAAQPTAEEKRAARRQLWLGGFCCGTALAIASNFQQAGIVAGTDAGKAGFLTALYVVLVPVFGLFFKRKVSLPVWVAVALSVVSLYLLCIKGSFRLAAGDLLVLVCAVCFAVHILVIDRFSATCDGVKLSCVQFLFAALWSGVCIPFFEHVDAAALLSCALPLLYVGVFSCGVGYTLQILAQKGSNPTVVTILLSLESVFAVIAGAIILHQSMTPREYLGCVLMFLAVVLAQDPAPAKTARAGSKIRPHSPLEIPRQTAGIVLHRFASLSQYPLAFLPKWGYNSCQEIHSKCMHKEVDSHETDTRTAGRARRQQGRSHGQGHENARHVRRCLRRGKNGAHHEHLRPHGHQLRH